MFPGCGVEQCFEAVVLDALTNAGSEQRALSATRMKCVLSFEPDLADVVAQTVFGALKLHKNV